MSTGRDPNETLLVVRLAGCIKNLAYTLCLFAGAALSQDTQQCRVVGIIDGDTIIALCQGNNQLKIRLSDIDAPEKKQPFGQKSKESLSGLCFGKRARIEEQGRDRYGRTIAHVNCDGIDANAEQVRRGMAWVYDKYVQDRSLYRLQEEAQRAKRGLWSQAHIPPWDWRKEKIEK